MTTASTTRGPIVRPYGDTTGDGMVQVSFTPVSYTHLTLPTILLV